MKFPAPTRLARHIRPAAMLLLAVLAGAFLVEVLRGAADDAARLLELGALPDDGAIGTAYWRILSFGFLHSNLTHLLLNMLLLLIAAPMVERRIGGMPMLLTFVAASVASGAAILAKHALWPAPGASVGASGGAFGVLAAALLLSRRDRGDRLGRWILSVTILAGLAYSLLPGISLIGHLAGMAAGAAIALLMSRHAAGRAG